MAYAILLAPPAERQLKALAEAIRKRIVQRLRTLRENPRPHGVKKLAGEDDLYRIREGDYRIIYTVRDRELIVLVVKIGSRKEVYRT
jgi:mRNA interferase RelE/StbE